MNQSEKARHFKSLHVKGAPVVLYNIWDAGGANALSKAGAAAVATGSWSVAAAQGYDDGEAIPLAFMMQIVERIAQATDLPLTVDFEGGYSSDPKQVAENTRKVIKAGAIGVNFEDRVVQADGLYSILTQVARIKAMRQAAASEGVPLFINARTDLFLGTDQARHPEQIAEAIDRAAAYAEAGADGYFVPGLTDLALIEQVVDQVSLPVNVMMRGDLASLKAIANVGVARASYGPGPYFSAMSDLTERFNALK
ncbi:2-Methylisocitrate lyase, PEP mutase family [Sulfitobacter marinus]|uniref:2-Methylisocitrate lyase, PEP mutase family n=1 Tax=Sulfitobacter marinus TaxID=394264 RepID=A0A1I6TQ75_9RHOB|nr:isocitrate lyase/phosphoenolpyruvate mutase family protein [Sulfitobacter marinus]SFS91294.1 2-Methylisocitrate lyase, PEP mutase family [Sulfitobacter marinus]